MFICLGTKLNNKFFLASSATMQVTHTELLYAWVAIAAAVRYPPGTMVESQLNGTIRRSTAVE